MRRSSPRSSPRSSRRSFRRSQSAGCPSGRACGRMFLRAILSASRGAGDGSAISRGMLFPVAQGCARLHQGSLCGFRSADGPGSLPGGGARHRLFVMAALEAGRGMSPAALPRPTGRWRQRRRRKCARLLPSFRPCRAACSSGSWPGMSARWAGWRLAWRSTWTARRTVWRPAGSFAGAQGRSRASAGSRTLPRL